MTKFISYIILFVAAPYVAFCQDKHTGARLKHFAQVHYNIGGLTPVPLPATIRQIKRYSPGFSPGIGYEAQYTLNDHWSLGAGLRIDIKGMKIRDSVQYFHTLIKLDDAEFEGDFSGTNFTDCRNTYLSLPLTAIYALGDKWRLKGGVYASWLITPYFRGDVSNGYIRKGNSLGEKVVISKATFDFAEEQRTFDWGLQLGGQRLLGKRWFATADLAWGLRPVFPDTFRGMDFRMYNIFLSLGAGIRL